ncbi:MAG: cellulase family glycosylhydrolase [Sedimentisphaeraceae bacterium JB056]
MRWLIVGLFSFLIGFNHCVYGQDIIVSDDGRDFVNKATGERFVVWGVNYDHDVKGRLLEDYWVEEWDTVCGDFAEMKELGANVVRIHLQTGKFLDSPTQPNSKSLTQLSKLLKLAEENGLYLNITGLGCYHKQDIPQWYDQLSESDRWDAQCIFWEAVAKTAAKSSAVFCYDLMNEPAIPTRGKQTEWLVGKPLGDKYFVQRITLCTEGRKGKDIARAWINKLVSAIRKHDSQNMVTVGVIPWAHVWPNAKPFFYDKSVSAELDFVSVHFYPEAGKIDKAVDALKVYDIGKPLVVEEMFGLKCGIDQIDEFIDRSSEVCDGWISFYWGQSFEEYKSNENKTISAAVINGWLGYFKEKGETIH